jgi:hypothetical protein
MTASEWAVLDKICDELNAALDANDFARACAAFGVLAAHTGRIEARIKYIAAVEVLELEKLKGVSRA